MVLKKYKLYVIFDDNVDNVIGNRFFRFDRSIVITNNFKLPKPPHLLKHIIILNT